MDQGSCAGWGVERPGPTPWQVAPGKTYNGVKSGEMVRYALMLCRTCPAQWDCATYAVKGTMLAGTWGLPITQLRWLQGQDDAIDLIEMARRDSVPVQVIATETIAVREAVT